MIRIQQLKLGVDQPDSELEKAILKQLKIRKEQLISYRIIKKSIDARKKEDIKTIYTIDAKVTCEKKILNRLKYNNIMLAEGETYSFPVHGSKTLRHRPVIIGSGPAGLFAAYFLSRQGYHPLLIEQGEAVEDRMKTVNRFWSTGLLNPDSNVQFGEGGAGTFSDGKLNTLVNDKKHRNRLVLETFVENGAKPEILFVNKPHMGTDVLCTVVRNIRQKIVDQGGEVRFNTKLTGLNIENEKIRSIEVNHNETIECEVLVLAIGHSARDTFRLLESQKLEIEPKDFAIGLRIEHPQEMISIAQYGRFHSALPPAEYKLAARAANGRNVYSFCMCPGGYVINSSSEQGKLVINGMSNSKRDGRNGNSAVVVSVGKGDFDGNQVLAGIDFVQELEARAYKLNGGKIPVQLFGDFESGKASERFEGVVPCMKGDYELTDIRGILPETITSALIEGIHRFGKSIEGFDRKDCILSAIETRTSSPVRILRNQDFQSNVEGIYPCGEGAGYAGGITSAAMDGIRIFEAIAKVFTHFS